MLRKETPMATSTVKRRKVKIAKTPEQIEAEKQAAIAAKEAAREREWSEYVDELVESIQSGDLDKWWWRISRAVAERGRSRPDDQTDLSEDDWNNLMSAKELPSSQLVSPGTLVNRVATRSQLVGNDVLINDKARPKWLQGMRVRVIRVNPITATVRWVDDPTPRSNSSLAHEMSFRCSYSLLAVAITDRLS